MKNLFLLTLIALSLTFFVHSEANGQADLIELSEGSDTLLFSYDYIQRVYERTSDTTSYIFTTDSRRFNFDQPYDTILARAGAQLIPLVNFENSSRFAIPLSQIRYFGEVNDTTSYIFTPDNRFIIEDGVVELKARLDTLGL